MGRGVHLGEGPGTLAALAAGGYVWNSHDLGFKLHHQQQLPPGTKDAQFVYLQNGQEAPSHTVGRKKQLR